MDDINAGAVSQPVTVAFRPQPFFSRRLLILAAAVLFGAFLGMNGDLEKLHDVHFVMFMTGYLIMVFLIFAACRLWVRAKGGAPPLRFGPDGVEFPRNFVSSRVFKIPYAEILSVAVYGKAPRQNIVIDTKRRAFVYPIREFASPDSVDRILDILKPKILARDGGDARWKDMEQRRAMANVFSARKATASRGLIYGLVAIYLAQVLLLKDDSMFGLLDIGANASYLVWDGEWFRLVTANLLHLSAMHIFCNATFGLVVGILLERQLGTPRFALVVLVTGFISQLVSALWARYGIFPGAIYSVGISGALFGMLGAMLVLNRKFGNELPGGYRLTRRGWWSIFIINFVFVPLIFWQVDTAAHIGGLVSGIFMGWLLTRGQTSITQPPEWSAGESLALTGMSALWLTAIAVMILHAMNPATLQAEHDALIKHVIASSRVQPEVDNDIAWEIAVNPAATPEQLQDAWTLASRVVEDASAHKEYDGEAVDTLATIYYRKHEYSQAIALEEPLVRYHHPDKTYPSQLTRFLMAYYKERGARILSNPQLLPRMSFPAPPKPDRFYFDLQIPVALPKGAEMYAFLTHNGEVVGLAQIILKPTDPKLSQGWSIPLPDSLIGQPLGMTIVQFDDQDCNCKSNGLQFFRFRKEIAKLP